MSSRGAVSAAALPAQLERETWMAWCGTVCSQPSRVQSVSTSGGLRLMPKCPLAHNCTPAGEDRMHPASGPRGTMRPKSAPTTPVRGVRSAGGHSLRPGWRELATMRPEKRVEAISWQRSREAALEGGWNDRCAVLDSRVNETVSVRRSSGTVWPHSPLALCLVNHRSDATASSCTGAARF